MQLDTIYNMDCMVGMKELPDNSIDLIITDPPYDFGSEGGAGSFGMKNRPNTHDLDNIRKGISNESLEETLRVMKTPNIYIWCNKKQLRQYIDFYEDAGCYTDLLAWHKTNPIPRCSNQYLPDTEYLLFFRKNSQLYGSYETKRKFYVSSLNTDDRNRYGHPTIKPLGIIKNLILNSSRGGDVVLDPYIGSGTTAVAARELGRHYIGYEIDSDYFRIAQRRINEIEKKWF